MKNKSARLLGSIVALGIAAGTLPAMADSRYVEQVEKSLQDFVAQHGKDNGSYPGLAMNLVSVYLSNGMAQKADETFKQAVESAKAHSTSPAELPGMYMSYAMGIAQNCTNRSLPQNKNQKAELDLAHKTLLKGLSIVNQSPEKLSMRLNYLSDMIECYKMGGMKAEASVQLQVVDQQLKLLESDDKLKPEKITQVASTLIKLSRQYCPSPMFRAARMMQPMQVVSDDSPIKPNTVKSKDFKAAEAYQLRAMAQFNKLPENDPSRIEAQRAFASWYHLYGQTKQEEFQTQQLSKLMHTTDRNKLFPQPPPCPACGMG